MKDLITVSVQTEIIRCEECEYPADDMHELVDHMHWSHPLEDYENDDYIKCSYCREEFHIKSELMMHIQNQHPEKVKQCVFFIEGKCTFGNECWFSHDQSKPLEEFKCAICESKFTSKFDLMHHRKKEHGRKVPKCKNEKNGCCQFGPKFCWFIHTEDKGKK